MKAQDYRFLKYDSWLACHEPYPMERDEVLRQIQADPDGTLRDHIDEGLRRQILAVVHASPTLEPLDKTLIKQALTN